MNTVFLSDGSDIATLCAKETRKSSANILLLVLGPKVSHREGKLLKKILKPKYGYIKSATPYYHPKVKGLADSGCIDLLMSCFYEHKIEKQLIDSASYGGFNIHPSVLPYNGGFHTSFWGILNNDPLGATIHWLAPELDCGGIIEQATFRDNGLMTAASVRQKQRKMCFLLFKKNLRRILSKKVKKKSGKACNFHKKGDIITATTFKETDKIDFGRLCRLARGTNFGNNGIRILTKEYGPIKAKIFIETEKD
jgi:hypothetical protein